MRVALIYFIFLVFVLVLSKALYFVDLYNVSSNKLRLIMITSIIKGT